ncbi:MAG: STAS domain-containing protein [Opitutaceae bacterium]|jgi:anti-sigma B factor antagonist/stage II sporulation protein AA (anti-sigma F factor antagonist)
MLEITQTAEQGLLRIALKGDITSASAPQLEQALAASFQGTSSPRWLLDLEALSFTSSAGLRVFLSYAKKIKNAGGRLVLCGVQASVLEVLEMSGFTQILTLAPTADDARRLLAQA